MRIASTARRRPLQWLVALLALALLATACGGGPAEEPGSGEDTGGGEDTGAADAGPINIGWIPWAEDVAVTFLWKEILEQEGYEVEETQLDVGPVFAGVAQGDLDLFLDAWLPSTHEDYYEQYGDQIEDLGVWYDRALLTIAVPEYAEAKSLENLTEHGDTLGKRIVGIEPGAGLTRITREKVMPGYGLDDWQLVESSTPAMLAELDTAVSNEEPIVVTLWRPHWAYAEYPLRDLEDPQGLLGEAEEIHALARTGFAEEFPTVAEWFTNFEMNDEELASLSAEVKDAGAGKEQDAAAKWLSQNQDVVDAWLGR